MKDFLLVIWGLLKLLFEPIKMVPIVMLPVVIGSLVALVIVTFLRWIGVNI